MVPFFSSPGFDINTLPTFKKTLSRVVANCNVWLPIATSGFENHSWQGFLKVGICIMYRDLRKIKVPFWVSVCKGYLKNVTCICLRLTLEDINNLSYLSIPSYLFFSFPGFPFLSDSHKVRFSLYLLSRDWSVCLSWFQVSLSMQLSEHLFPFFITNK